MMGEWRRWRVGAAFVGLVALAATPAMGQQPTGETRAGLIAEQQAKKARTLHPYQPSRAEEIAIAIQERFLEPKDVSVFPYFDSAYAGGGLALGAGWRTFVSSYDTLAVRGSLTFSGYKRIESEWLAPRLFDRRGRLSVVGGWREATGVGFYGLGTGTTSSEARTNYGFQQPYASANLEVWPTRRLFVLGAGVELTRWKQREGSGRAPSVEEIYSRDTLPGLGASPTYVHARGSVALDWRDASGYSKRGGYYGVTLHSYADRDDLHSFRQVDYDVIQHLPLLRDTWVVSLRGRVQTTHTNDADVVPFFMMPSLGGSSSLRGFPSWRFRDLNSLLLSADWRVLANRFLDVALFCDAGKVTARRADLNFDGLKSDCGVGFRFHGPATTPLRVEFARSNEGLQLVFSANAAF
ncbi:MAG: BamA/TamA family outer membrane protein [Acidobacteria bacterium]|nr:BamA/TamA family outer membrane protein [Acidobacteriota bacterium]